MRRYALLSAGAVLALLAGLALWLSTYTWSYDRWLRPMPPGVMVDNAQLYPRPIARVERPSTDDELAAIVAAANARGDKVTMAGSRHSQGGHTYSEGAVVLDMRAGPSPSCSPTAASGTTDPTTASTASSRPSPRG